MNAEERILAAAQEQADYLAEQLRQIGCAKCVKRWPHMPGQCTSGCPKADDRQHAISGGYANYGYAWASCALCGKRWELDSSG